MTEAPPILELRGIDKSFPGVQALRAGQKVRLIETRP